MASNGNPTLSDVLSVLHDMNGKLEVALDRTQTHERVLTALNTEVSSHGKELASVKTQSTFFGAVASAIMVGLIEGSKSLFGGHGSS